MAAARPPPLPEDLVEEILLRLPPDDPACLLRASLVCKAWGCVVSRRAFRRRLHELHGTPPLLGFLHYWNNDRTCRFVPTTSSSFSLAVPDQRSWRALDCRHGRALFVSEGHDRYARELLVWEPITGAQQRIPWPAAFPTRYLTMAVLCAADGCDHRDCLGGPFHVLIDVDDEGMSYVPVIWACAYSSETGAWSEPTSSLIDFCMMESCRSSLALVGRSLLYFMFYDSLNWDYDNHSEEWPPTILEYDLSTHTLTAFSFTPSDDYWGDCHLVLAEDGGLGVIQDLDPHLKLWTIEARDDPDARWVLSRVIDLGNLIPTSAQLNEDHRVQVMGFVEGANVILVDTVDGIFAIELQSEHVRKVCSDHGYDKLIPVVSFYTPVPQGKHQNLPASKPSEEAGGEEGGEEEKTVDWAQQLLSKGSNDIQEGDFVNTFECVSNDHNIRSAPNEEPVKGTTNKDDAGDSKTSGSSVEGVAPSSEKGDSQEEENSNGNNRSTRSTVNKLGVVGRVFKCGNVKSAEPSPKETSNRLFTVCEM